jgi:K+-transporting ATPase ATPase B chain
MHLDTPARDLSRSSSTLIIVMLIPLALRGQVPRHRGSRDPPAQPLIYGVGGLIAPFIGIGVIDLVITALG